MSRQDDSGSQVRVVGISGSATPYSSKSRLLLVRALDQICTQGGAQAEMIELSLLPAEALLGRRKDGALDAALASVRSAHIVVVSTPVYRASYSGLLKVFLDLLPSGALTDKVGVPIATGGSSAHQLVLEHALRPLLASLGALVGAAGVYGSDDQFQNGSPEPRLVERVDRAASESLALLRACADVSRTPLSFVGAQALGNGSAALAIRPGL